MKTAEELNALKEEIATLNRKLTDLTEEDLNAVTGGFYLPAVRGGYFPGDPCPAQDGGILVYVSTEDFKSFTGAEYDQITSRCPCCGEEWIGQQPK